MENRLRLDQRLRWRNDAAHGGVKNLPEWAKFSLNLGIALSRVDPTERRLVVGLDTPTRRFLAALIAAGFVIHRDSIRPVTHSNLEEHFLELCSLPPGTPVTVRRQRRSMDATIIGVEERNGIPMLKVKTRNANNLLPMKLADDVTFDRRQLPKNELRSRKVEIPDLLAKVMPSEQARIFVTTKRFDCAIAGVINRVDDDLRCEEFAARRQATNEISTGCLQSLVRVEDHPGIGSRFRTRVLSPAGRNDGIHDSYEEPTLAIFDSRTAYDELVEVWLSSHHVAIVDRSEARAAEMADTFNLGYMDRIREVDAREVDLVEPPGSIAISIYEARSR